MTNDFDPKTIRKSLDALRAKHGADTPIGYRCSKLIEQLKRYPGSTGEQRANLEKFIAQSVAELSKLSSGAAPNAEERGYHG